MKKSILKLLCLALLLSLNTTAFATNRALLIGIGQYQDKTIGNLEGPVNDVTALNKVLQQYWGFDSKNIKTLIDKQATKTNILAALTRLKDKAKAGDQIFIYYSGHGTSDFNKDFSLPLPYNNSGALILPGYLKSADRKQQFVHQLIIGKRDLRPIFLELDKTKAQTMIVFDTCYSGNTVRAVSSEVSSLPSRTVDLYDDEEVQDLSADTQKDEHKIEPYPYQNILYLSAASSTEPAKDISQRQLSGFPTMDNKPHGAFTDAFLRALSGQLNTDQNGDGKTVYSELLSSIIDFMSTRPYAHTPQILPPSAEDHNALRFQNVMGMRQSLVSGVKLSPVQLSVYVYSASDESLLIQQIKRLSQVIVSPQRAEINLKKVGDNYVMTNISGGVISTLSSPSTAQILGRIVQESWKKQFKHQLQQHASINLELSVNDGLTGSSFVEGESVAFSVRSDKPMYLLLLNAESEGGLSVLYPYYDYELKRIPAHKVHYIPSENKQYWPVVKRPFGTEHLIAIGFAEKPAFLTGFIGKDTLLLQSDLYKQLMASLKSARYGFSEVDIFTVPAR